MSEENKRNSESWGALMVAAQAGDANAYETLLAELSKAMRGFLSKRVPQPHFVEDIVQEVLIGIHKARHTYDPSRDFRSWAFAVARYKLIDFLRKWKRQSEKEVGDEQIERHADAPVEFSENELSEDLQMALGALSEKQRRIVESLKVEGKSVRETASAMGMSESAVKVNAHRAYKKMKDKMEKSRGNDG